MNAMKPICLTPFRELHHGNESIHRHVGVRRPLPERVRQYLLLGVVQEYVPGFYRHPFSGGELLGPALLGDHGHYTWDRDTLEYVEKYGLELPQAFIEFVMSGEGFLSYCRLCRRA